MSGNSIMMVYITPVGMNMEAFSCNQSFSDHCFQREDVLVHNCSVSLQGLIRCMQYTTV